MTDDYLGLLLAESCILFLNWYQKERRPIATAWAIARRTGFGKTKHYRELVACTGAQLASTSKT